MSALPQGRNRNIRIVPPVDFTVQVGDTFNRPNNAILGNTDGGAIDGITGGDGFTWTVPSGSWRIINNTASPTSVGRAIVEAGKSDGVLCASITAYQNYNIGLIFKYINGDNHAFAYINKDLGKIVHGFVVGGVTTNHPSLSIDYVDGAEFVIRMDGIYYYLEYNGEKIGVQQYIDYSLEDATKHGMFGVLNSSLNYIDYWHFINLPEYKNICLPSIVKPQTNDETYSITVPVRGDKSRCSEYELRANLANNIPYLILKYGVVTNSSGVMEKLSQGGYAFEYAGMIGADADIESDYKYFGSIHHNERLVDVQLDVGSLYNEYGSTLSRWKRYYCHKITLTQTMNLIYPVDETTIIGWSRLIHEFMPDKMVIKHNHTWESGYKIYSFYTAMLPFYGSILNTYQVGNEAVGTIANDGADKNIGTQSMKFKAWKASVGTYTLNLLLPYGGPDNYGDWSIGAKKMWLKDNVTEPQKLYVSYSPSVYANRISPQRSIHEAQYYISNGIPD